MLFRSIYEDMTIWDLKDTVYNPVLKEMYKNIYIIDEAAKVICEFQGEKLVQTERHCREFIDEKVLENHMQRIGKIGKKISYYQEKDRLVDIQRVCVDAHNYILFFEKILPGAE